MFEQSEFPQDSWPLDRLASYARIKLQRTAVEAWHIGRALLIAETKLKDEKGFDAWVKREVGISRATSWRYRQMASIFTHEEVQQLTLGQIYDRMEAMKKTDQDQEDHDMHEEESVVEPTDSSGLPSKPVKPAKPKVPEKPMQPDGLGLVEGDDDIEANGGFSWARGDADRLNEDEEFDITAECDKFIKSLDDYRASNEWTFSDPAYVARVREKLGDVLRTVAMVQKAIKRTKAA